MAQDLLTKGYTARIAGLETLDAGAVVTQSLIITLSVSSRMTTDQCNSSNENSALISLRMVDPAGNTTDIAKLTGHDLWGSPNCIGVHSKTSDPITPLRTKGTYTFFVTADVITLHPASRDMIVQASIHVVGDGNVIADRPYVSPAGPAEMADSFVVVYK